MPTAFVLIVGGTRDARRVSARTLARRWQTASPGAIVWEEPDVASWPFRRVMAGDMPAAGAVVVVADEIDRAFPSGQTGGTRLVLTQSTYVLQKWLDELDARGNARLVATSGEATLRRAAPEAFAGRGPWGRSEMRRLAGPADEEDAGSTGEAAAATRPAAETAGAWLRFAFTTTSPRGRLDACRRAAAAGPDAAVAHLALASACMEQDDLEAARAALDRVMALAGDWAAAHFERGKLWLRLDDLERASAAFRRAGELMPGFSAAFGNLGATLGELGQPAAALEAFGQALQHDPNGYTIHNNLGVLSRELGRLDESEAAFRRVTALAPDFAFGHYNLGHTLFLQGRYEDAAGAYAEGQRRDPARNPRQASRLALARLGAGDSDGALRELQACWSRAAEDALDALLAEAREVVAALTCAHPTLAGAGRVAAAIDGKIADRRR